MVAFPFSLVTLSVNFGPFVRVGVVMVGVGVLLMPTVPAVVAVMAFGWAIVLVGVVGGVAAFPFPGTAFSFPVAIVLAIVPSTAGTALTKSRLLEIFLVASRTAFCACPRLTMLLIILASCATLSVPGDARNSRNGGNFGRFASFSMCSSRSSPYCMRE